MRICPICTQSQILDGAIHFDYDGLRFELNQCLSCQHLFYVNAVEFNFREDFIHNRSIRGHIEKNADVEQKMMLLFNLLVANPHWKQGVDIGCGIGIVMDFAFTMRQCQMIGFEPSPYYSEEGRNVLNLHVISDYFDSKYLDGRPVDFITCFQLLQLVPDPLAFLKEVKKILNPGGLLVLSTPDNEELKQENALSQHFSAFSPGVHRQLFSKKSLQSVLNSAGFVKTAVFRDNGHLFALAGSNDIPDIDFFKRDPDVLTDYYKRKLQMLRPGSPYFSGFWYRLYRTKIDKGDYQDAFEMLSSVDWFDVWSTEEISAINKPEKLFELNTAADAIIYYYTAILFLNYLHKTEYAEKFFELSFHLCSKLIQLQPDLSIIERDIVWLAKYHQILTLYYQGKTKQANLEAYQLRYHQKEVYNHIDPPSHDLIEKVVNLQERYR